MPIETLDIVSSRHRLAVRQINVQRRNLVHVCRFTIKTLVDSASFDSIDENNEELINFFAIMEQMLVHRLRPQKTWFGTDESPNFWEFIKMACKKLPHNCISSIKSIESIQSGRGKGRAWLRMCLMEKRLTEYINEALQQTRHLRSFYQEDAIMMSEDAIMICEMLLGLNAIDFSFCLKGDNMELSGPLAVDFSPYLHFEQSPESISRDHQELQALSSSSSSVMSEGESDDDKSRRFEQKYKTITDQKGYLEELLRLRDIQLNEAIEQKQNLIATTQRVQQESQKERKQLESVVIELQAQLAISKDRQKIQQQQMASLIASIRQSPALTGRSSQAPEHDAGGNMEGDQQSYSSLELSPASQSLSRADRRYNAETQSLVPLAGSFSGSEQSIKVSDINMSSLSDTKVKGSSSSRGSPVLSSIGQAESSGKSKDEEGASAIEAEPAEEALESGHRNKGSLTAGYSGVKTTKEENVAKIDAPIRDSKQDLSKVAVMSINTDESKNDSTKEVIPPIVDAKDASSPATDLLTESTAAVSAEGAEKSSTSSTQPMKEESDNLGSSESDSSSLEIVNMGDEMDSPKE